MGQQQGIESDDGSDGTRDVAAMLRVPVDDVVRVLGGRWRSARPLAPESVEQWFLTGDPAQVAVGTDGIDPTSFLLGRPAPRWNSHQLQWHFDVHRRFGPEDLHRDPDGLRQAAEQVALRRRRSFRWCSTCRELTPPEWFLSDDGYCMGCAAEHHHVLF